MKKHKDAVKKVRQAAKRRARNVAVIAKIKTLKKAVEKAATPEAKKAALGAVVSAIAKAKNKKILHSNTASRLVSRISRTSAK